MLVSVLDAVDGWVVGVDGLGVEEGVGFEGMGVGDGVGVVEGVDGHDQLKISKVQFREQFT